MRNLKRALSLVMAMALIVGMMVISASAVSVKDFTDSDEIQHNEAVNTMVALNVINGKEDGSYFDPTGTLTRAEMAKLVTYILNGGVEPVLGEKVTPTYSDIDNTWAEKYIEYCSSMGIIAGDGQGKFNPTGTLTASQAAKMLLTAMNYKDDIFGFLGNAWEINVNREANAAGLYKELGDVRAGDPISRDDAAQMVYNAIQSKTMQLSWGQNWETGEVTQNYRLDGASLFSQKFNGTIYEGVLLASGSVNPYGISAGKEKLTVDAEYVDGDTDGAGRKNVAYAVDCTDMIGEYVKVLYNTKDKVVYGVYTNDEETTVVINTTVGALSDVGDNGALTYDGVSYDIDANANAYRIGSDAGWTLLGDLEDVAAATNDIANYDSIKLVDNNGDGALDVAFVVDNQVAKVTYVGSDTFTLTNKGSVKNADAIFPELAVDDYVSFTYKNANFEGKYVVSETTALASAKVTEVGENSDTPALVNRILVDGTWYTLGEENNGDPIKDDSMTNELDYNTTYNLVICNGYVVNAEKVVGGNSKVAVITGSTGVRDYDGNYQVRLLLADGSTVEGFMDGVATGNDTNDVGKFVSYTIEDGIYKAVAVANTDETTKAGYDHYASGTKFDESEGYLTLTGTPSNKKVNKDAVVFVQYDSELGNKNGSNQWIMDQAFRVTNGAELNSWKKDYGTAVHVLWNDAGLGYADVVYIVGAANEGTPGTTSNYGYITSAVTKGSDDSGVYCAFTIWDGTDSTSVIVRASSVGVSKGDVISFTWGDGNEIKIDSEITGTDALVYSNGEQVRLGDTGYDLADDVTIINVNTKDVEGVGGNAITTAAQTSTPGEYYYNCWYKLSDDNTEIVLLVIDVTDGKLALDPCPVYDSNS